jgi:hypothetical protein
MNEAVRLARIADNKQFRAEVMALLSHPVYSIVVSIIIIEALQQIQLKSGDYFMSRTGTVLETALITKEAWQALASSDMLKTLLPAAGKLLAAAG